MMTENWIQSLVDSGGYAPHITCYLYDWGLILLNGISDMLMAAAYFIIPAFLMYLAKKFPEHPGRKLLWLFGIFIVGCGATHLLEVWNIWSSNYWVAGWVKLFTAIVSLFTASVLWKMLPMMVRRMDFIFHDMPAIIHANHGLAAINETTKLALDSLVMQADEAKSSMLSRGLDYREDGPMARLINSIHNLQEALDYTSINYTALDAEEENY